MHFCSNFPKKFSRDNLAALLGLIIVIKDTPWPTLACCSTHPLVFVSDRVQTIPFHCIAVFWTVAGSYAVPLPQQLWAVCNAWGLVYLPADPSDCTPPVIWFLSPWSNAYLPSLLPASPPWTELPAQPPASPLGPLQLPPSLALHGMEGAQWGRRQKNLG